MNGEPKHDFYALLRDLREQAEVTFPGWSAFMTELAEGAIAEQEPAG